jgi:hypothetical protein
MSFDSTTTKDDQKRAPGRPTKYKPEYVEQVKKLCKLGATDAQIADFFEVDEATINNWKQEYPKFFESIKVGKAAYDDDLVEASLAKRARGFVRTVERLHEGIPVECKEEVPPDTTACIFWLKNRKQKEWRDRQEMEHSVDRNLAAVLQVVQKPK